MSAVIVEERNYVAIVNENKYEELIAELNNDSTHHVLWHKKMILMWILGKDSGHLLPSF